MNATSNGAMVSLDDVEKVYRTDRIETVALSGISLAVAEGEFVSVMGPSGCGKSTLLHVMGLLDVATRGSVSVGGQRVDAMRDAQLSAIRNRDIGFVFQTFHLIADLSVADNVEIPLLYRKGIGARERRERAMTAIDRVGLGARARHFPSQLSGGQQQRVAIARAIAGAPRLLLADEPTGNLDSQMGDEIMAILHDFNTRDRTTVVMVTHDQRLAEQTSRTFRLFDGRLVH